jgi:hypothetical protein
VARSDRGRDEFVQAGSFPCPRRAAMGTDEAAQARRDYGDRTLRASSAGLRPAASASAADRAAAVLAWAGRWPRTPANPQSASGTAANVMSRSQRCPSRRERD